MQNNARIYVADHRGLAGSAVVCHGQDRLTRES